MRQAERVRAKMNVELIRIGNRLQTLVSQLQNPIRQIDAIGEYFKEAATALLETSMKVTEHTLGHPHPILASYLFLVGLDGFSSMASSIVTTRAELETNLPQDYLKKIEEKKAKAIKESDIGEYVTRVIGLISTGSPKKKVVIREPAANAIVNRDRSRSRSVPLDHAVTDISRRGLSVDTDIIEPTAMVLPGTPQSGLRVGTSTQTPPPPPKRQKLNLPDHALNLYNALIRIRDPHDDYIGSSLVAITLVDKDLRNGIRDMKFRISRGEFTQDTGLHAE
jgi:hypothetical protein